jgi:hypothetical protein
VRIEVPRHPPPRFPDRCVVCGRNHPRTTALLLARVHVADVPGPDAYSVEVPSCWRCALYLHFTRIGRVVAWIVFTCGLVVFLVSRNYTRETGRLIASGALWVVSLGIAAVHRWLPPLFALEAAQDSATFVFRDLSLGYEFRALNPAARDTGGLTSA